jgi:hypothetical protein
MNPGKLEFMFRGMPVGYFEGAERPQKDGLQHYMPYRGPGHLAMQREWREKGRARCSYEVGFERVSFDVVGCPEYGILDLADFEARDAA